MRWSIIRLIFLRELRDQLRDRRTIFMIAVLPLLLYPILGLVVMPFAAGSSVGPSVLGVAGSQYLPTLKPTSAGFSPLPATAWFTLNPAAPVAPELGVDRILGSAALAHTAWCYQEYPPLLVEARIPDKYLDSTQEARALQIRFLETSDRAPLEDKQVDLILTVPPDFCTTLKEGGRATLELAYRDGDERSRQAVNRLHGVLARWEKDLRELRLRRRGLPADYADPIDVTDAARARPADQMAAEGLMDLLVRIFPFLLVMWSLAGALYPAVDLCAGEKERGTMETLLISPASREEIVWGKFLTIWVFSAVTALLNLASMGVTTSRFSGLLTHEVLRPAAIFWCVVLALPLSAFFSAICLAVGAYARSSKEGQYYLMPLFLVTMPLVFLTLAPGVELNPFYSLVPVTGVALLMQRLMTSSLDRVPWHYFVPVLAPMALYSWLALRWAIEQFKREEVLFREAERLDITLWLRRLFREKEAMPSAGQALFCFALIVALRWLSFGTAGRGSLIVSTSIIYLAFVGAPPLFMALLLTTRPRQGLALRLPSVRALLVAALLAGLLLPPMGELIHYVFSQFPGLVQLLSEHQPLFKELLFPGTSMEASWWQYLLVFVLMPALFEEMAFRGFILNGLRRRLQPWPAILLSSFLFALYHMNVFQVLPSFVLGVVLGLLTVRSGSILPGILYHLLHNGLLIVVVLLAQGGYTYEHVPFQAVFHPVVTVTFALLALALLAILGFRLSSRAYALVPQVPSYPVSQLPRDPDIPVGTN